MANTHAAKYYNSQSSLNDIYDNLTTLSSYENSEIWLINPQGEILLNTSEDLNTQSPEKIINFDPASFNSGYYQIGHFFHRFSDDTMSVLVPITLNFTTRGYIAIHQPMEHIYEERESVLQVVYILFLILFLITSSILVLLNYIIHRPLRKSSLGWMNLHPESEVYIPVSTEDEMGYLAASLNYMSDELDKMGRLSTEICCQCVS